MEKNFTTGWRQVGIGFVLLASVSMIASCYSIIAVPLLKEYHPSRFVLGLAMMVLSGVSAVIAPFLGSMMDKLSLRNMMMLGGLLLAAGYAALSLATSFNHVLIVFGVLIAPANVLLGPVAVTVLLSRWFVKRRGLAIGIAICGVAAGSIVYPMIIQGLLNHHSWREAFQLLGMFLLAATVPVTFLMVNHPHDKGLFADGDAADPPSITAARNSEPISAWAVLSDPTFWLAVLVFGAVTAGMKGMVTNLSPLALDNGISATAAAGMVSIYGAAALVSKGAFALIADRIKPRLLMIGSLAGYACGMALMTQAHFGYGAIVAGICLIGVSGGMMVPMQSYLMPRIFGERVVGKAYGLMSSVTLLSLMITPPLFGKVYDMTRSYSAIFMVFAGLAVVAMLAVAAMRLHPRGLSSGEVTADAFK
jgi:MFS family permease